MASNTNNANKRRLAKPRPNNPASADGRKFAEGAEETSGTLAGISDEDILNPPRRWFRIHKQDAEGKLLNAAGEIVEDEAEAKVLREWPISAMVEGHYVIMVECIEELFGNLEELAVKLFGPSDPNNPNSRVTFTPNTEAVKALFPTLPKVLKMLLSRSTEIIALSLDEDEEWVARNITMEKRIEVIRLIAEAENIFVIRKNLEALVGTILKNYPAIGQRVKEIAEEKGLKVAAQAEAPESPE